jgi:hypothetical protein
VPHLSRLRVIVLWKSARRMVLAAAAAVVVTTVLPLVFFHPL